MMKILDKCPKPLINTGCTYCKVNFSKPISGDNLNLTKALPYKHLLYVSHGLKNMAQVPSKYNEVGLLGDVNQLMTQYNWKSHPILTSVVLFDKYVDERHHDDNDLVYLYPDNIKIEFNRQYLTQFIAKYLLPAKTQPVYNPFKSTDDEYDAINHQVATIRSTIDDDKFIETPIDDNLWLICGHGNRDARCGEISPYLVDELNHIKSGNDKVGLISHIGGHAYAGNLIIYPENWWYGRVMPDKVQGIYNSWKQGQIIKELYRGDL